MTINIGINLGKYIILAADTRTVYFLHGRQMYTDENQKIQKTKIGLITSAGHKGLLDEVKYQLAQRDIKHTDQIIQIIKEQVDAFSPRTYPEIKKVIDMTGWLLTYKTLVGKKPILRLALLHPQFNYELALYGKNKACVIMPFEANEETTEAVSDTINKKIKPLENISKIKENISYHSALIKQSVSTVSKNFESVSPTFHIGVHSIDGKMGISTRVENEKFSISIS
ncbi:hypothetical protein ES706_00034 [subsurface metagenome]|nr:hypothetical protein [Hadesarchaea archaeon]